MDRFEANTSTFHVYTKYVGVMNMNLLEALVWMRNIVILT